MELSVLQFMPIAPCSALGMTEESLALLTPLDIYKYQ